MTFTSWATDGEKVGALDFLANYWIPEGARSSDTPIYTAIPAKIISINPYDNPAFQRYELNLGGNQRASPILRASMQPLVRYIFGLEPDIPLEEVTVTAFIGKDRALKGFGPAEE